MSASDGAAKRPQHQKLEDLVQAAPEKRLKVFLVLKKEDQYETTFGDGKYLHFYNCDLDQAMHLAEVQVSSYVVRSRTFYPSGLFATSPAKRPAVFNRAEVFLDVKDFHLSIVRGFAIKQARADSIDSRLIKRRKGAPKRGALPRRPAHLFPSIWAAQKGAPENCQDEKKRESAWYGPHFGPLLEVAKPAAKV
ncbi:unnamed protein product [Amoebophrya sp. A120]|nr:unnamed protein product [Amoebophrya sp. A120]|eukprot:GSA120T00023969001.1